MKWGFSVRESGVGGIVGVVPIARSGLGGVVGRRVRMWVAGCVGWGNMCCVGVVVSCMVGARMCDEGSGVGRMDVVEICWSLEGLRECASWDIGLQCVDCWRGLRRRERV